MVLIAPQKRHFGLRCTIVGLIWLAYSSHCRFRPRSCSTFFFLWTLEPMTGLGCYLEVSKIGPPMGPPGVDKATTLGDLWDVAGDHLVTMGVHINPR